MPKGANKKKTQEGGPTGKETINIHARELMKQIIEVGEPEPTPKPKGKREKK